MKLKNFIGSNLRQVGLASMLAAVFSLTPAVAVEIIGTPTAVGAVATSVGHRSKQLIQNNQTRDHALNVEHTRIASEDEKPLADTDESTANRPTEDKSVGEKSFEESLAAIKEHNRHMEAMSRPEPSRDSNLDSAEILIPITAISFSIGGAILLIIVLARLHYRDKERRAENINANIDRLLASGRDIPIELLRGDEFYPNGESSILRHNINLHKGLKNVCLGVGLFAFLSILCGIEISAVGFILMGLGSSQLLVWKLSGTKTTVTKG